MRRLFLAVPLLALAAAPALADTVLTTPAPKALDEAWEAAFVQNAAGVDVKIGYIHMSSVPVTEDGTKLIRTTKELRFTVARAGTAADMKADVSADEDGDGKVRALKAKIWLGKDRIQTLDCKVIDGPKIRITADGELKWQNEFRWDPNCVGLAREQTLLREKKAKTGDEFSYRYFEPQVANYVTVKVVVTEKEVVALPGGGKRELLKVIATPEPLKLKDDQLLRLPAATFWADPVSLDTIKTVMDVPAIGNVTLIRTSKVAALAPNGQVPDLMKQQSIFLASATPDMHDRDSIVYRVTYKGEALPKELVATDARQTIQNASGHTFDLAVTARRKPVGEGTEKAGPEFLKSNYFLNSDDSEVKKLAVTAVGKATDPWDKARRIEHWVRQNMRSANYTEALAPADHVARTLTGDCTEYAMLTAGMCKAQGIPARTAIGLVYVNNLGGRPGLGFHMWTEVFVKGQWLALDATLGQGSIGAGHIKINDHSWAGVLSFTPLLPVNGFLMAKPQIEVVKK